jgi:hypothetical protein
VKKKLAWTGIWVLTIAIICFIAFRVRSAPIRDLYSQDRTGIPPFTSTQCRVDPEIEKLIARAQFDHLISPIPRWGRKLVFKEARFAAPNDIYLIFMPSGETENAIVYCCARESGRLLWKALWVRAA